MPIRLSAVFSAHFLLVLLFGCQDRKPASEPQTDLLSQRAAFFIHPVKGPRPVGQTIDFQIEQTDSSQKFDSVLVLVDDQKWKVWSGSSETWNSSGARMGTHNLKLSGFRNGTEATAASLSFYISSDLEPVSYSYEIVKSYPHNTGSYTQGLEWQDDQLYEGTGLNGKSAVLSVRKETGEAIIRQDLTSEYFGEGITILNNRLYQITWQNKRGFVYSLPDLKMVKDFGYPTDGWGLTHFGGKLVMTDGGNTLYFLSPENFQSLYQTEVWDRKNPVGELNELETVNDRIWANKYQTDTLVELDPTTGKVTGYADLKNILPESDRLGNEDVLNGIAYHRKEKLFYVTGKNWPRLYAIRLIRKPSV